MKRLFLIVTVVFAVSVNAQIVKIDSLSNWKKSFKVGLNLNQVEFKTSIVLYDYDQDDAVQVNEAFSLGIFYTFQNYKP